MFVRLHPIGNERNIRICATNSPDFSGIFFFNFLPTNFFDFPIHIFQQMKIINKTKFFIRWRDLFRRDRISVNRQDKRLITFWEKSDEKNRPSDRRKSWFHWSQKKIMKNENVFLWNEKHWKIVKNLIERKHIVNSSNSIPLFYRRIEAIELRVWRRWNKKQKDFYYGALNQTFISNSNVCKLIHRQCVLWLRAWPKEFQFRASIAKRSFRSMSWWP